MDRWLHLRRLISFNAEKHLLMASPIAAMLKMCAPLQVIASQVQELSIVAVALTKLGHQVFVPNCVPKVSLKIVFSIFESAELDPDPPHDYGNIYPCIPGKPSPKNWSCDGCDTVFPFEPGMIFVPQILAAKATGTVTETNSAAKISTVIRTAVTSTLTSQMSCSAHPSISTILSSCPTHPSTSTNLSSCSTNNHTLVGVSVGLGAALAVSVSASLLSFLIERKKRKQAEKSTAEVHALADSQPLYEVSNVEVSREADSVPFYELGPVSTTNRAM